jgi:hypothetical protein
MSSPSTLDRFRPHAVPVVVFATVAIATIVVPPLVLGEITTRTYAITAALVILAAGATLPYAVFVGIATLPLLYVEFASYAAPRPSPDTIHSFSPTAALRHVFAGIAYSLGAAVVGAIGIGAQMGTPDTAAVGSVGGQPAYLVLGGVIVAVVFVVLQLWRYDTAVRTLERGTLFGTAVLGLLVALSPVIAFWTFNNAG